MPDRVSVDDEEHRRTPEIDGRLGQTPPSRLARVAAMPKVAAFVEHAPAPDRCAWGDPRLSEAEDRAIMNEFEELRRDASRDAS